MKHIAIFFSFISVVLGASSTAHAQSVEIVGGGISNEIKKEIADNLGDIEQTDSKFTARRQARRAATIGLDVLKSKGWLAAQAETAVETGPPLQPIIRLNKGPRFTLDSISIAIEDEFIDETDIPSLNLKTGDYAQAKLILDEEKRLLATLKSNGYAEASKLERLAIGDKENATLDLTYNFLSGPKICLGEIQTNNSGRTKKSIVHKLSPYEFGDLFSPDTLEEYKKRLSDTQLYKYVKIELLPAISEDNPEQCQSRDLLVTLEDASRRTVTAGLSYATTEGFGAQAGYEMRNYTGRADTINIDLLLNNLEQSLSTRWKQPLNGGYKHSLTLDAAIRRERTDAYDSNSISANALYERPWTRAIDLFAGVGVEVGEETQNNITQDFQILSGRGGARFDNTDNALDPSHGVRLQISAEPAYGIGDINGQFVTTTAQLRGYTSFASDKYIIAGRVRVGGISGSSFADIPSTRRFYAGGGGSVRGYEFQSIGPRNSENEPIGGRSLVETSLEARVRLKNKFGFAVFADAGEVGSQEMPEFSDLRMGVGAGIRYYTNFGPLRLDLATPVNPRDDDQNLLLYLSIGQAF